jgi:hypothetical protein
LGDYLDRACCGCRPGKTANGTEGGNTIKSITNESSAEAAAVRISEALDLFKRGFYPLKNILEALRFPRTEFVIQRSAAMEQIGSVVYENRFESLEEEDFDNR